MRDEELARAMRRLQALDAPLGSLLSRADEAIRVALPPQPWPSPAVKAPAPPPRPTPPPQPAQPAAPPARRARAPSPPAEDTVDLLSSTDDEAPPPAPEPVSS